MVVVEQQGGEALHPQPALAAAFRGGEGSPLVCLHGFTDTWWAWKPVLPQLAREHCVYAPTLPGHFGGPGLRGAELSTMEDFVDLVEGLLDDEGIDEAHLVGNSGGGWVALALAARGRALSVTALSPAGGWEAGSRIDRPIRRFFARSQRLAPRLVKYQRAIAARPRARAFALRDVVANPRALSPDSALRIFEASAECEIAAPVLELWRQRVFPTPVAQVDCPVRLAWGTHDSLLPAAQCSMGLTTISQAEWLLLPGAGHVPTHDDPERVARVILELTRRVDRQGAVR